MSGLLTAPPSKIVRRRRARAARPLVDAGRDAASSVPGVVSIVLRVAEPERVLDAVEALGDIEADRPSRTITAIEMSSATPAYSIIVWPSSSARSRASRRASLWVTSEPRVSGFVLRRALAFLPAATLRRRTRERARRKAGALLRSGPAQLRREPLPASY